MASYSILLSANLDAAFDAGLISFSNDGAVLRSDLISNANFVALGIGSGTQLSVTLQHNPFLGWHRREHGYCSIDVIGNGPRPDRLVDRPVPLTASRKLASRY
jgi:hypothetical protein